MLLTSKLNQQYWPTLDWHKSFLHQCINIRVFLLGDQALKAGTGFYIFSQTKKKKKARKMQSFPSNS